MSLNNLSGIIASADGGAHDEDNKFRRYLAVLTTTTKYGYRDSSSTKNVVFNVGRRGPEGTGLGQHVPGARVIAGDVALNEAVANEATARARSSAMASAKWNRLALGGLVERLAAGIAHYATFGTLTYDQLSGGADVDMVAVGVASQPCAAVEAGVFVPVGVDDDINGNTMAALLAAVNGEGSTLFTEHVGVDTANNQIIAPTADGEALASGCWSGLNRIAQAYAASDAGALFSYALVRGMHKVCSVAAHSDEGGYVRDVLRTGRFEPPHGVVHLGLSSYNALPKPVGRLVSYRRFVDSILLSSAGLVAESDPLVEKDGAFYPTLYTATRGAVAQDAGIGVPGEDEDAIFLSNKIALDCSKFVGNYVRNLCRLLGFEMGGINEAKIHMEACFRILMGRPNRHLRHKSVAPWFWIEPTGVVLDDQNVGLAAAEGYGRLCTPNSPGSLPMFRGVGRVTENGGATGVFVDWRSARRHGAVIHSMLHEEDGLANMRVSCASSTAWAHVGGADKGMRDRLLDGDTLDSYMWGRGHSSIPGPSEALYTGKSVGLVVVSAVVDGDPFTSRRLHSPSSSEIKGGVVTVRVTNLSSLGIGRLAANPKTVRRQRSLAAEGLEAARELGAGTPTLMSLMPVMDIDGEAVERGSHTPIAAGGDDGQDAPVEEPIDVGSSGTQIVPQTLVPPSGGTVTTDSAAVLAGTHGAQNLPRVPPSGRQQTYTPRLPPSGDPGGEPGESL